MKKLLLAVVLLVGSVLPSMAQNHNANSNQTDINSAVVTAAIEFLSFDGEEKDRYEIESIINLKALLQQATKDDWKSISNSTIRTIMSRSIAFAHDASFIEFLVDWGMPGSEFDRYIRVAQERMDNLNRIFKKLSEGKTDEGFSVQEYETCEEVLELLKQGKEQRIYESSIEVDENMGRVLNEERMRRSVQQYQF